MKELSITYAVSSISTQQSSILSSSADQPLRRRHKPAWTILENKYWLNEAKPRDQRWARYIVLIGMAIGLLACIAIVLIKYMQSNRASYVLVLHDTFEGTSISTDNWQHEQQLGGYIEGSFDVTSDSTSNSWVAKNMLHITPTVLERYADGTDLNLTATGQCTSTFPSDCYALQNSSGSTAIPNIQTARLRSRVGITYGKVEVTAKLPKGDWLFSTIGLDPDDLTYGQFPASGKIDIAQSRGNDYNYASGGRNKIDTIVHFGSDGQAYADCADLARNQAASGPEDFHVKFHTFGIEWTPHYIRTWLDYPSNTILQQSWKQGFWRKAGYSIRYPNDVNFEYLTNPWTNGTLAAPYDRPFHLTLRTNVGAVSGIFGMTKDKPWYDAVGRGASMLAFQNNQTSLKSWQTQDEHTMYIKEVKMWQQIM